jgi:tryptophanase
MKTTKITTLSTFGVASLALIFSACANASNTTTNTSTSNTTTKANTAVVANSNQTAANNTATVSNTAPTPAAQSDASDVEGELQVGKTESVILYVGMESGDYAGYCFTNDSEAGRAILAACKDKEQCAVKGTVDHEAGCKVPGLEADLSDSGKITKVESVKSLGPKKK